MIFRFTPEADAELTEARQWYSHHRKDLDLNSCSVLRQPSRGYNLIRVCSLWFMEDCGALLFDVSHLQFSMK
jgi:hypothetical protein